MNVALWVGQAVLALLFLLAGAMKISMPISDLAEQMGFVTLVPAWLVRFIGLAEIVGAIGLILPALFRIKPWLTPVAAAGLATVMAMAFGLHLGHAEYMQLGITGFFLALLLFVTWGRFSAEPVAERGKAREKELTRRAETAHAH